MKTDIDRRLSRSAFPGSLPALANGILNWDIHRHSEDFRETVLSRRFQDIRVSEVSGGGCSGRRGDTHFLRDGGEFVALVCQLEGRVVCRERVREVRCEPGDVFLWSSRNSLEFRVDEWARTLTLIIPASRIDSVRVRSLSEASAFLGPDSTLGRLASAFFASLAADLSRLTQEEGQNAMTMAMGIVSSILRHAGSQGPGRERGNTFSSICSYIDRQLNNDRLKPGQIAEEHGISLRYLHMLFSQHDQTVAGYIREQRLFKSRLDVVLLPIEQSRRLPIIGAFVTRRILAVCSRSASVNRQVPGAFNLRMQSSIPRKKNSHSTAMRTPISRKSEHGFPSIANKQDTVKREAVVRLPHNATSLNAKPRSSDLSTRT